MQFLILLVPISIIYYCEPVSTDISHKHSSFIGTYNVVGTCEDVLHVNNFFADEKEVVIKAGTESDLLINIKSLSSEINFKASVSNDSLFIPLQWWTNTDGSQASFQANGAIRNDSLFLHYGAGGSFGLFDCDCKGKKVDL